MAGNTVPVAIQGWTTSNYLLVILNGLFAGGLVAAIVKVWPALKKIAADREANLLTERAEDMKKMDIKIRRLEAEQRVDRHTIANLELCLDTLLLMIELNPTKANEAAAKVLGMREAMKSHQATEKAGLHSEHIDPCKDEP